MPRPSPLEQHLDIVGVISDRDVAEQLDMTPENVRAWRVRRGIPAGWRDAEGSKAGAGKSKKAAESNAAAEALERYRSGEIDTK